MSKLDRSFPKKETFMRINYLYQAARSVLMESPDNVSLARYYISNMKTLAKKSVLRLDPSIKRNLCKKCWMILIPGLTSTSRISGNRKTHVVVTCLECRSIKRYFVNKNSSLWTENPDAWITPPRGVSELQELTSSTVAREGSMKRGNWAGSNDSDDKTNQYSNPQENDAGNTDNCNSVSSLKDEEFKSVSRSKTGKHVATMDVSGANSGIEPS